MEIRRVLYPTDFSAAGAHAFSHARKLASVFGAELTSLFVRMPHVEDTLELETEQAREVGLSLAQVKVVRGASPAEAILEFASAHSTSMIVMGTHGHSAFGRFLLGSVSEKVVRYASCPVLTVRPVREGYRSRPEYRRILAAYDFSEFSKTALRGARDLARRYEAELHVLHVIDTPVYPAYYRMWKEAVDREQVVNALEESIWEALGEGQSGFQMHVVTGEAGARPHREIEAFTARNRFDLLVLGSYGLSGVEQLILGSTTERLIRSAPCPVVAFHR